MNAEFQRLGKKLFSKKANDMEISDFSEIDFSKICRTCLRETEDNDLANDAICIINSNGKLVRIYEMFEAATGLKINSNDILPHHICSPCLQNVNSSYSFRVQSERSHQILQTLLNKCKDDPSNTGENEAVRVVLFDEGEIVIDIAKEKVEISEEDPEPYVEQCDQKEREDDEESEYTVEVAEVHPDGINYDELSLDDESFQNIENIFENGEVMDIEQLDEAFEENENSQSVAVFQKNRNLSFQCDYCESVFMLQRDIIQHYKIEHPTEKPFKCEVCSVSFVHIQSMRRHKKTHEACPKQKKCPICCKLFQRSDDLSRHIRTHTDERPYSCSICSKAFKQHTELKDHMLSHTDTKMYKCDSCNKEWRSRNGWYLHMKSHKDGHNGRRKRRVKKLFNVTTEMDDISI